MNTWMKKGISLIENIIAVLILGIVIAATVFSFGAAQRYNATARHHYEAVNFAREMMERIIRGQAVPADNVLLDPATGLSATRTPSYLPGRRAQVRVAWNEALYGGGQAADETIVMVRE